jgi:RHS repeat-associated protein
MQLTGQPSRFSLNGKEHDDSYSFDLYYYGSRYMSPSLGRFVTPDPVDDFLNPYSYVGNNPMNRIDPTGMTSLPAEPALVALPAVLSSDLVPSYMQYISQADLIWTKLSPRERAAQAIEAAKLAADNMAAHTQGGEKTRWENLANLYNDILNTGNWNIRNDMASDVVAQMKVYYDQNTGAYTGHGPLNINANYCQGNYPIEFLTSYIIHEGSHVQYAKEHNLNEFKVKDPDPKRAADLFEKKRKYAFEHDAYGYQCDYMGNLVDFNKFSNIQYWAGWASIIPYDKTNGREATILEILKMLNPHYHFY